MELIKLDAPELGAIDGSKAEMIRATFEPMAEMLRGFEEQVDALQKEAAKEITKDVCAAAKRLRLDIAKVRIQTEKVRKDQKEEFLRAGRAIDGVSNILKWAVERKEDDLKKIENHFELMERERLDALQAQRVEEIREYVDDAHLRDLSGMDPDVWNAYLSTKRKDHEDRLEAERQAAEERERIAREEAEQRALIAAENERLRKEAVEREAAERLRQAQAAEELRKEREARAKEEERLRKEAEAEAEIRRAAHEAEVKKEREAREKVERELREKREQEAAEAARIEAEKEAALSKGDAEKIDDLIAEISAIAGKYKFASKSNKEAFAVAIAHLQAAIKAMKP